MSRKHYLWGLAGIGLVAIGYLSMPGEDAVVVQAVEKSSPTQPVNSEAAMGQLSRKTEGAPSPESGMKKLPEGAGHTVPPALAGTSVIGHARADDSGQLIVDGELRALFDYFMQVLGAEDGDPEWVKAQVLAYLEQQLQEPALGEAKELFNRYWDYRREEQALMHDPELKNARQDFDGHYSQRAIAMIEEYRMERGAIRRSMFNEEEYAAFFESDDQYDRNMLERLKIQESDLSPQEKSQALANLDAAMPQEVLEARKASRILQDYKATVSADMSDGERYQQWESEYGTETAQKLVRVDQQRKKWEAQQQRYASHKARMSATLSNMPPDAKREALRGLMRDQLGFSDLEMRRMQVLDSDLRQGG